jgi:hypothetical protein
MITKNGEKFWRFDYARPYTKKRNSISLVITLSLVWQKQRRDDARTLLAQNIDPQVEKLRIENEILNANKKYSQL